MTLYAGERIKIVHTASLEGTALDDNDVNGVDIILYDSDLVELVARTSMSWDATNARWAYDWDTTGEAAGSYRAQVILVNADASEVWEWQRIRLSRNPND